MLREGTVVGLANHTVLIAKDGTERPIDDSAAPIRDAGGRLAGVVLVFRDVTERRRAEEARRRLAAIVESSDDAIIGKDLDGTITSWNAGAERVYGYPAAEVLGKPFSVLVPPDRTDEVRDAARRLQRGERLDHFETVRRRKDGTLIDVSVSYSPVKDDEGHLVGTAVITRDITDQKRAEERLRRSEQDLADFFENATVGLHWVGPDGTILRANRAELDLLGYAREEYVGRNIAEFHADQDVIGDILRAAAGGREAQRLPGPDAVQGRLDQGRADRLQRAVGGRAVRPHPLLHPRRDRAEAGRGSGPRAGAALAASEQRFRTLTDHAPVGIFLTDAEGNCLSSTGAGARWPGCPPRSARAGAGSVPSHPEDRERVSAEWTAAASAGREFASRVPLPHAAREVTWLRGTPPALRDGRARSRGTSAR